MKVRILGSGTSTGVPQIGCTCPVCTSADPKDNRLRASAIVETEDARILIDCGPDFRAQVLHLPFEKIDGVLITHEHYDHVGGLDDLRPFCRFGAVPIYAEEYVARALRLRMPYCFVDHRYPGVPDIPLQEIEVGHAFSIHHTEVVPLRVMHGRLPILPFTEVRPFLSVRISPMRFVSSNSLNKVLLAVKPIWTKIPSKAKISSFSDERSFFISPTTLSPFPNTSTV